MRVQYVYISFELIESWMTGKIGFIEHGYEVTSNAPDDIKILSAQGMGDNLRVIVESQSFDEVLPGMDVPIFAIMLTKTKELEQ